MSVSNVMSLMRCSSTNGLQQYGVSVKVQKSFLTACKSSYVHNLTSVDAHSLKRLAMSNGGDYKAAIVLKADETAIEEMVNARSQKQTVLAVEPLLVG